MNYKQKYKAALERARMINNGEDVDIKAGTTTCEYIFPELAESEDEKIRKALLEHIVRIDCEVPLGAHHRINGVDNSKIIAWLEKQKEKKI